jgi:hypothetical protein
MRLVKLILCNSALFFALALCMGLVHAQQNEHLTGRWNMVSTTPEGSDIAWTLSITYKDGTYGAMIGGDEGETAPKDLKVEGSKVHMLVPYHGGEYDIDLSLKEDKLAGTWSGNGDSGPTKGEKAAK